MTNSCDPDSNSEELTPGSYAEPRRLARPAFFVPLLLIFLIAAASIVASCTDDVSLEKRAARGDAKAQYFAGKRRFDEAKSAADYLPAVKLIRTSAEQGFARAQAALGLLYENGVGVPQNYEEAVKWLRRAADQGFGVAQNELGVMYAKGLGVPRDLKQAAAWCRLAAAQGVEVARRNSLLAEMTGSKLIPRLITTDNRSFNQVRIQRVEPNGVTISFLPNSGGFGLAKLKIEDLPAELRRICQYAGEEGQPSDSAYSQVGGLSMAL